jgi:hypothetical protein
MAVLFWIKLVQIGSKKIKIDRLIILFKSDTIGSNRSKLVQIGPKWFKLDHLGSTWFKSVQIGSNQINLDQISSNWF